MRLREARRSTDPALRKISIGVSALGNSDCDISDWGLSLVGTGPTSEMNLRNRCRLKPESAAEGKLRYSLSVELDLDFTLQGDNSVLAEVAVTKIGDEKDINNQKKKNLSRFSYNINFLSKKVEKRN